MKAKIQAAIQRNRTELTVLAVILGLLIALGLGGTLAESADKAAKESVSMQKFKQLCGQNKPTSTAYYVQGGAPHVTLSCPVAASAPK